MALSDSGRDSPTLQRFADTGGDLSDVRRHYENRWSMAEAYFGTWDPRDSGAAEDRSTWDEDIAGSARSSYRVLENSFQYG